MTPSPDWRRDAPSLGGDRAGTQSIRVAVALTVVVLLLDAIVSLWSGLYLNLGTGVWLALARDVRDGIFYRPIWNGAEYGGTRYFPMLFVATGALMRMGVAPVPAGLIVSLGGLIALVAAVITLLHRWSVPRPLAILGGALVAAPYFVHQTGFAVRCEPLAAAFAVAGLAVLGPPRPGGPSTRRLGLVAVFFVAAFATKLTCVYAPAAAVAALLATRQRAALTLALFTIGGGAVFLLGVHLVSQGRALESFRACAFAGVDPTSLLSVAAITRSVQLIATSHLLTVVFAMSATALAASRGLWREVPGLYLLAAAAVTGVIFTSPGTILTSQIVDAYVAAIVVLVIATARARAPVRAAASAGLVGVALWAAAQNGVRMARIARDDLPAAAADRRALVAAVHACGGSLLSESPLIPLLAGQRPVLLDPFAFHVVGLNRPEVARNLAERIARGEFACIVLEQDPTTDKGRAWYRNVNLSDPVVRAVLDRYTFDRAIADERFYRVSR